MRQRILMGAGIGAAVIVAIGLLVWASQQGTFGPSNNGKHLLARAKQAVNQGRLDEAQRDLEELIGTFPSSPWADDALLLLGQVHENQQHYDGAQTAYRQLLDHFPSSALVAETQKRLGNVNIALLFSPIVTDLDTIHQVRPGDTLGGIARANHTTIELIKRANSLEGDTIFPSQKLKVPKGHFSILVDKSQNELLLAENERFVKTYPVATGTDGSTPEGTFTIVNKVVNPIWYRQGAIVPPESAENILGTRWMGISEKGFGIHGTTQPESIGAQATAGCVRMTNSDVEELFAIVPVGTEVTIVD